MPEFLPVKRRRKYDSDKMLNLRVPPKMKALLRRVASKNGNKVAVVVRKYIVDGLKEDGYVF